MTNSESTAPGGWFLAIARHEFVTWGYGPEGQVPSINSPVDIVAFTASGLPIFTMFSLPEGAMEYRRELRWGWRWVNAIGLGTLWALADTLVDLLQQAKADAMVQEERDRGHLFADRFLQAYENVVHCTFSLDPDYEVSNSPTTELVEVKTTSHAKAETD